jgi:hypothetical protein
VCVGCPVCVAHVWSRTGIASLLEIIVWCSKLQVLCCCLVREREEKFKMIADGHLVGDGSWELKVLVTDLSVERCLRVKGDLHIGGVMLRLVEELGSILYAIICCPCLPIFGDSTAKLTSSRPNFPGVCLLAFKRHYGGSHLVHI